MFNIQLTKRIYLFICNFMTGSFIKLTIGGGGFLHKTGSKIIAVAEVFYDIDKALIALSER